MAKKDKPARNAAAPEEKKSPFASVLRWAGAVTALLSLVFGLQKLTQSVAENRERERHTTELYLVGKLQQSSLDYSSAWKSFESGLQAAEAGGNLAKLTGQLDKDRRQFREAQEDLAMEWLENIRITQGETFTSVIAPLTPVLTRGITISEGNRKADLIAHLGWATFLRWRDGARELNPESQYRQALEIDSLNPYAHAYLGHWKVFTEREDAVPEANAHFAAALRADRGRADVRSKQVASIIGLQDAEPEALRLVSDMLTSNDSIDGRTISRVYGMYWSACHRYWSDLEPDTARFQAIRSAIPMQQHIAIFESLFADFDRWRARERDACRAILHEAEAQRAEAIRIWTALRASQADDKVWVGFADAALKRLAREPR